MRSPKVTMRASNAVIAMAVSAVLGVSCASRPPGQPRISPAAIDTTANTAPAIAPARKLPNTHIDLARDWYPWQGRVQNLQGQTLIRFQIDRHGKAEAIRVLTSDAAPVLQVTALRLIQSATFDLATGGFDAADKTPFLVAIRFCIDRCDVRPVYPGLSDSIVITGSHLQ